MNGDGGKTGKDIRKGDAVLESLLREPVTLSRPKRQTVPFVFASPHSGRMYPEGFLRQSRLDPLDLRKSEDAFVDELFDCVPEFGAPLLQARFPRAFIDANRSPSELDPVLFREGRAKIAEGQTRSARVAVGLGVIPRIVRDGLEIYAAPLSEQEIEFRLESFYRPYHAALSALVEETKARFGLAIVIDCHSMPPPARGHDVVLGDRYGESMFSDRVAKIQKTFVALGFNIVRNVPYAGGYTTALYGRPDESLQALQIELNRDLYLDENAMEKTPAFAETRRKLRLAVERMLDVDVGWQRAAE